MKAILVVLAAGVLVLIAQGALATVLPGPYCPDLGLLVVLGIGLRWEGLTSGIFIAAVLGFVADLLSGSLLGQHTLLRLFAFLGARVADRQLNLRGVLPLLIFGMAASLIYAVSVIALGSFVMESAGLSWPWLADALRHAPVNAVLTPAAAAAVGRLSGWLGEEEGGRRPLRLEAGRRPA